MRMTEYETSPNHCPKCEAAPGEWCVNLESTNGSDYRQKIHPERRANVARPTEA